MTIGLKGNGDDPKGSIEDYGFPDKVTAGMEYSYSIVVRNVGGEGTYGCGVVNKIGNPGLISIIAGDSVINVNQGEYLRTYKSGPAGDGFVVSRKVVFSVIGIYTIPLWGMYMLPPDNWYYTPDVELTIEVVEEEVPEDVSLWEKFKEYAREHPLTVAVGFGSVVAATVAGGSGIIARRKRSQE